MPGFAGGAHARAAVIEVEVLADVLAGYFLVGDGPAVGPKQ